MYKYIDNKGLRENVFLKGWVDKQTLLSEMKNSSIYLSTSIAEGMSNSLLEAISMGLIPVCLNIKANNEVLGSDYKFLIDDYDLNKWVKTIINLRKYHPQIMNYLDQRLKQFDIRNIMKEIQNLYES